MLIDDIHKNYNKLGTELIETIYSNNYLSIGGTTSTEILAEMAGVSAEKRLLDVGSGVGGPALHLAEQFGCDVTGLDLVADNVDEANSRAASRNLAHLTAFHCGNAMDMPFADAQFDIVWGQDAWCHVPDKTKLVAEAARVLAPEGVIAFTDWIEVGKISGPTGDDILAAMAAPNLATRESWCKDLAASGFRVDLADDVSSDFTRQYSEIMRALTAAKQPLTEKYGTKVYKIVTDRNACILQAFQSGALGGCRIVAKLD